MSEASVFDTQYKRLTLKQKKTVDTVEGPVMVIAGPGTGKTTILTLRIANILRVTDAPPNSILALTFTESAGYAMRRKLKDIIGPDAYKVHIHTFHSFSEEIIQSYPEYFPGIIGSNHINEIDQVTIIESIIEENSFTHLKPYGNPLFYVRPVLSIITDLKREDISPDDLEEIIKQQEVDFESTEDLYHAKGAYKGKMKGRYQDLLKKIEKNKELLVIYRAYQEQLRTENLRDFDDMIMMVVRALEESEELRLRLQEEYHYILADEHQDANRAQNKLLEHLTSFHENPNLFIVGDEKQAIFRFQGASLENFLYFKERFPQGEQIILEDNFRSHQEILDVSHSLISYNEVPFPELRIKLESFHGKSPHENPIKIHSFTSEEKEHFYIAQDIQKRIDAGANPDDIAVLYRNNRDVELLIPHLEAQEIPFVVESKSDILSDLEVEKLFILLSFLNSFGDDELLSKLLHIDFLNLDPLDVYKIHVFRRETREDLITIISSKSKLKEAGVEDRDTIVELFEDLKKTAGEAKNLSLISLFPNILSRFSLTSFYLDEGFLESYKKITALYRKIKELSQVHKNYTLEDFLRYVASVNEHGLDLGVITHSEADSGVRLMTAHRSKGLEFDVVYITRVVDKHWGNRKNRNYFHIPIPGLMSIDIDSNEDERRLLYVAMTRSRKEILLTYAHSNYEGKELVPSQFIAELDDSLIEVFDHSDDTQEQVVLAKEKQVSTSLQDYIQHLFFERGLAVTSLNNYLACPWRYFYSNLLRVPETPARHQTYGIAVHNALRDFFNVYKKGEKVTKKQLLTSFDMYLVRASYGESEVEEGKKKGHEALSGYFDTYNDTWERNVMTEYNIKGVPISLSGEKKELILKGKLDKVEILSPDGEVNVVDYKTGKPKSRNFIEGKTKNSNGDYKRQLVFYKLLLDSYAEGKWSMNSAELDFIEPTKSGKYKKEQFSITQEEVSELTKTIERVSNEIISLSFWDTRCDDAKCEYCRLRDMMKTKTDS